MTAARGRIVDWQRIGIITVTVHRRRPQTDVYAVFSCIWSLRHVAPCSPRRHRAPFAENYDDGGHGRGLLVSRDKLRHLPVLLLSLNQPAVPRGIGLCKMLSDSHNSAVKSTRLAGVHCATFCAESWPWVSHHWTKINVQNHYNFVKTATCRKWKTKKTVNVVGGNRHCQRHIEK